MSDLAWCADLEAMLQPVIARAHACSIGPRYVKSLKPKRNGGNSSSAWFIRVKQSTHIYVSYTEGNDYLWWLKRKERGKLWKQIRNLTNALEVWQLHALYLRNFKGMHEEQIRWLSCTWCKHGVAHFIVTLNPRWNFTPTNQSAASLNATRWMSLNFKIHSFAFEQNASLLLPRKFTGPSLQEELINATLPSVPDSREAPEKRKMKDRP